MILYTLICDNEHRFEAWFRDSAAYDTQAARKRVLCPQCQSASVSKAPMAPAIAKGSGTPEPPPVSAKTHMSGHDPKLAEMLAKVRAHVEENFDYVGEKFPEEVRRIHYGETEERGIYGEASAEEAKSLIDEGIPVAPLPTVPRRDS